MKKIIKNLLVTLFYNETLKKITKRFFQRFPLIKKKLIYIRDGLYVEINSCNEELYKNDLLEAIKSEVELRKKNNKVPQ